MEECIFCKIANGETATEFVYEDEHVVAFSDINPKAPLHILVIPKKHIQSIEHVQTKDADLMANLIFAIQKVAKQNDLTGYKLQVNVGKAGGQVVDHLHYHVLAEKPL